MTVAPPNSPATEWSVVGAMLANESIVGEIIGAQVEPDDFFSPDARITFETIVEMHYADERIDALTVGERLRYPLSKQWRVPEANVTQRLYEYAQGHAFDTAAVDHARLVRTLSDKRRLMTVALSAVHEIEAGEKSPEEIGDVLTTETAKITTGSKMRAELMPWLDAGRDYTRYLARLKLAREKGIELAAYTGFQFFDSFVKGLAPTELMMVAGEPGVGKSACAWSMAEGFARRQMKKDPDKRIGTLILSMEMGLILSSARLAQTLTGIDGGRLREGIVSDDQIREVANAFLAHREMPVYFNFASNFRMSQMRALVVDAIRRYNVGLVLIDHFRQFDPDRRINNPNQEDEAKARFLKESLAKELNVAVICIAHTVKLRREGSDGRPTLADLRGSGQVAAHCDIVSFVYRPRPYASKDEIELGTAPDEEQAELIFEKNRSGSLGSSQFYMDLSRMEVRDRY